MWNDEVEEKLCLINLESGRRVVKIASGAPQPLLRPWSGAINRESSLELVSQPRTMVAGKTQADSKAQQPHLGILAATDTLLQVDSFKMIYHLMELLMLAGADFIGLDYLKPLEQLGQLRCGELFFSQGEQDGVLFVDMLIQ